MKRGRKDRGGIDGKGEGKVKKEGWGIIFWNVAGLKNKDKEFWRDIKEWEVIVFLETWVEEKDWKSIRGSLPAGYEWGAQWAKRLNKKGRAAGGMLMGIRKEYKKTESVIVTEKEGFITGMVKKDDKVWKIVGVYAREGIERALEGLEEWTGEVRGKEETIIGGDFNVRTGREGGRVIKVEEREKEERKRRSKDVVLNGGGKKLVEFLEEKGLSILNGDMKGDEEGEFTFTGGRGNTVIDYVIGGEEMRRMMERLRVGDKVDSDHHPLEVYIKGRNKGGREEKKVRSCRGVWNEEGVMLFREKLEGGERERGEGSMEEGWGEVEDKLRNAIKEVDGCLDKSGKKKEGWWDEECRKKKKELREILREWRREGGEGVIFKQKKGEYRKLCERKKKEDNERWEKRVAEAKRESDVWEIVNRERRKRGRINEDIKLEEWKEYFARLLGGVEVRVMRGERDGGGRRQEEVEEEISKKEIKEALGKLKNGKAMGVDEIPGEAWKYGGEVVEDWIWKLCNRVWGGEGWPEKWKEGVIVPLVKKGEGEKVEDYRGITIMTASYKVYVSILAERLRAEIESKQMIPHNQTGFRKGMGTVDNIYVLNYLVNRELDKKGGGMIAMFVDLKAAFDSVDRGKLEEALVERGVREGLVIRVMEILRETESRVRVGGEVGERFWTARGVRQGCPLSPMLFNLLTANLEERMGKVKWGGVKVKGERIYSLSYADDMVLLAEDEVGMKSMIARLEDYLDGKRLELNERKTKIIRFRKGGGREKKVIWRWKGKVIEEVKEFTYLGYNIQKNGGQERHVRERVRKAAAVMGQVWGIGKRRFGKDWGRRLWLFDRLVWTVMSYGVEIWGWKERDKMERLEERYLRWMLGVDKWTPAYLVREELQREKLRIRAGRRVWSFERRLEEGRGSNLARKCWEEVRERAKVGKAGSDWERERKKFFEERGKKVEEVEEKREEGVDWFEDVLKEDRKKQREERREKIEGSSYNKWYKMVKGEGIPGYLKKEWGESRCIRVARFRLGNEMRASKYWEREEAVMCRLCGSGTETWEHVWEECREWKKEKGSWQEEVRGILGEEGEGEWWMRKVDEERGGKTRGEGEESREGE